MRVPSIYLFVVTIFAIGAAYFAGRYVGTHDADKRNAAAMKISYADQSANQLRLMSAAGDMLRASKVSEASRLLDQAASLMAPAVVECLRSENCALWIAPTEEAKETLLRYAADHSKALSR